MKEDFLSQYKSIIVPITIIFILTLAIISIFSPHLENDEIIYKTLAIKLAHFQSFTLRGSDILRFLPKDTYATSLFFKPPVFFIYLSFFYVILGQFGMSLAPVITYALLIFIIYKTAFIITKSQHFALKALLISLFSSLFIFSSQPIHLDLFLTLMVSLSFYFLIKWKENNTYKTLILSGLFLSLAVLSNYSAVIFYPLFLVFLFFQKKQDIVKKIIIFVIPSSLIFLWLYNVVFINHMSLQQLVDKPNSFALTHFPFLQYVYHRPFYFYFFNIFLTNPIYLLVFALFKKSIREKVMSNYHFLLIFLSITILSIFVSLTYFGVSGGTYQMRYILMSIPFLTVLLTIIPFEKIRILWIFFLIFMIYNLVLAYYNLSSGNAELFNFFEIMKHYR